VVTDIPLTTQDGLDACNGAVRFAFKGDATEDAGCVATSLEIPRIDCAAIAGLRVAGEPRIQFYQTKSNNTEL
jgi:hypothetical protein